MKKIYITGVSGTGKSTIAKELKRKGIYAFSIDEVDGLCDWKNKKTGEAVRYNFDGNQDWFDQNGWMCDAEKLKELMNVNEEIVVVAGIASNQNEYLTLFEKVFVLQCKKETFIHRLMTRTDNLFGKKLSEQESLINFYQGFEKKLVDAGAISINAENPIDKVIDDILTKI